MASPPSRPFIRFLLVGPVGIVIGGLQYELLWWLNPLTGLRAATTWVASSLIGVAWVHLLHCYFTFRGTGAGRWRETIGASYVMYSGSIALGTAGMWLLVDEFGWRRRVSWLLTTAATSLLNFFLLRRLIGRRSRPSAQPTRIATGDLTVIVPTRNELDNIGPFLASVPAGVRLVVVDASDDGTPERIAELRPRPTEVVRLAGGIAAARQRGAEVAGTPWLLFTDADVTFEAGFFDRLSGIELDGATAGIVGTKWAGSEYRTYYRLFAAGQRALSWIGIPAATGSNMLVRRDALLACGGFDTSLPVNEDTEVMFRLVRAGHRVRFAPALRVREHDHRRLERGVGRKLVHSIVRGTALYLGLLPQRLRSSDWGYWTPITGAPDAPASTAIRGGD